jgi:uncharacterized UBP type Zn finger protein
MFTGTLNIAPFKIYRNILKNLGNNCYLLTNNIGSLCTNILKCQKSFHSKEKAREVSDPDRIHNCSLTRLQIAPWAQHQTTWLRNRGSITASSSSACSLPRSDCPKYYKLGGLK